MVDHVVFSPVPLPPIQYFNTAARFGSPDGEGCNVHLDTFGGVAVTSCIILSAGSGTHDVPGPTLARQYLGYLVGEGWYKVVATGEVKRSTARTSIALYGGDTEWTDANQPAYHSGYCTPPGAIRPVFHWTADDSGNFGVGPKFAPPAEGGTGDPVERIHSDGNIRADGHFDCAGAPGITRDVVIGGVTLHFKGGILTQVT